VTPSKQATMRRILALLDKRDMTVDDVAYALNISDSWARELLRAMPDEAYCVEGMQHNGTYRRGAAPAGHTIDPTELCRRAILASVAHHERTAREIAERVGRSRQYVKAMIDTMPDKVVAVGAQPQRNGKPAPIYTSVTYTPAPVVPRVALPLWAAALCA
jgi:predicted ArsR family transcriptional regulator